MTFKDGPAFFKSPNPTPLSLIGAAPVAAVKDVIVIIRDSFYSDCMADIKK